MAHFVFVSVFAYPFASAEKGKMDYYAQWYAYPFFSQNWNLFVPPPNTNYKLLVTYEDQGKQVSDIFNELLVKHQSNRFAGHSAVLLALSNSIHYFEKNTNLQRELNGPMRNDLYFQMLENSAKNYIQSSRNISLKDIKMYLCVEDISSGKMKVYYN